MKTLILMRHAKSDWSHGLPDHERPLNTRGQNAAPVMGNWLQDHGLQPDQVLCSSAKRTRETLDRLGLDLPEPQISRALYLASPQGILETIQKCIGHTVLCIGHNPGMGSLAQALVQSPPAHSRFGAFPTGATLVCRFQTESWQDISAGMGELIGFAVPRDYTD